MIPEIFDCRTKIKIALLEVHAAFWRSRDDDPHTATEFMRVAFLGVAAEWFASRFWTNDVLTDHLPRIIWEAAISGGWWEDASQKRTAIFCEPLGHYWVREDFLEKWRGLFQPEIAEWNTELLKPGDFGLMLGWVRLLFTDRLIKLEQTVLLARNEKRKTGNEGVDQPTRLTRGIDDTTRHRAAVNGGTVTAKSGMPGTRIEKRGGLTQQVAKNTVDFGNAEIFDFNSPAGRAKAVDAYVSYWHCSEASLARAAIVDPADLSKWKKRLLPVESGKANRIEKALRDNTSPKPAPANSQV